MCSFNTWTFSGTFRLPLFTSFWKTVYQEIIFKKDRVFFGPDQLELVEKNLASAKLKHEQTNLLILGDNGAGKGHLFRFLTDCDDKGREKKIGEQNGIKSVLVDAKWREVDEDLISYESLSGHFAASETLKAQIIAEKDGRRPTAHTQYRKALVFISQQADMNFKTTDDEKVLLFLLLFSLIAACIGILHVVLLDVVLFLCLEIFNTYHGGTKFQNWRFSILGLLMGYSQGAALEILNFLPARLRDPLLAVCLLQVHAFISCWTVWFNAKRVGREWKTFYSIIDGINILPYYNSFTHFFISGIVFRLETNPSSRIIYAACFVVIVFHARLWKDEYTSSRSLPWEILYIVLYFFTDNFVPIFCIADICVHCLMNWTKMRTSSLSGKEGKVQSLSIASRTRSNLYDSSKLDRISEVICDFKINILDFPKHELYPHFHRFFIKDSRESVYIVVFDIDEFLKNVKYGIKRLEFWLESILSKDHTTEAVFIVGFHFSSLKKEDLGDVNDKLRDVVKLFPKKSFVYNENDELLFFPVESMLTSDPKNKGIKSLKDEIVRTIRRELKNSAEMDKDLIPYSWFKVTNAIRSRCHTTGQSANACEENTIFTSAEFREFVNNVLKTPVNEETLQKMLDFLDDKGFVMHLKGENQRFGTVLLDHQHLIDVIDKILNRPLTGFCNEKKHLREHKDHAINGLMTEELLKHLLPDGDEHFFAFKSVLETNFFIFPLTNSETCNGQNNYCNSLNQLSPFSSNWQFSHIVPNKFHTEGHNSLKKDPSVERFYIQFHNHVPLSLFHQIMAQCYQESWKVNPRSSPVLSYYEALFWASSSQECIITFESSLQRIKVEFSWKDNRDLMFMIDFMFKLVDGVKSKYFSSYMFHCGPLCPLVLNQESECKDHVINILPASLSNQSEEKQSIFCGRHNITSVLKPWIN